MSTVVIQNTVTASDDTPLAGVAVRIELQTNSAGLHTPGVGASSSLTQPVTVVTDQNGQWSVGLVPNSQITQPTGTYYLVSEGGYLSTIVVPSGGGPYELSQVLTGTPPTPSVQYVLAPGAVQVERAGTAVGTRPTINLIQGSGMTVTVADNPGANRVDVTLVSTGGGGGAVSSVNGQTGAVVLDAADVGADAAGAAAAVLALSLQKASNLSDLANVVTARSNLGLGSAALQSSSAFDASGAAVAAQAASLQKTSNLSDLANLATARTNLGLGGAAVLNVGTGAGTVAAGDDSRITGAQQRSTLTVKGDLYAATGSGAVTREPVGSDGQVLTAASGQSTGLAWTTPTYQVVFPFSRAGDVSVQAGTARLYNDTGRTLTIQAVRASVGTAPTGQDLIVDVDVDGTTIFTTQANRPTIADGTNTSGKVTDADVVALPDGHYLTVDVDQVGSGTAGADLTVTIVAG